LATLLSKSRQILWVNMYITCQIELNTKSVKIGQTRLKSDRFYEFDRFWPISSFNPQKLKNLLPPCPSPLTLHYIVPTPQSPLSPLPKSQIFNLSRLTPALEDLGYGKALYCILGREGMIGGSKPWEDRGRRWGIKGVK
jgi:hypothetical protein